MWTYKTIFYTIDCTIYIVEFEIVGEMMRMIDIP